MQQRIDQVLRRAKERMSANADNSSVENLSARYPLLDLNAQNYALKEFLCHDSREFLHLAYTALLKRAPDPAGLTAGLARLESGGSVFDELWRIQNSIEGRRLGVTVAGLIDPTLKSYNVCEFIRDDITECMHLAYTLILKRNPDPEGLAAGLIRLKNGGSVISEVWRISQSEEAQRIGVQVEGILNPERDSYSLVDFVGYNPASFCYLAYATVLKRDPDPLELLSGITRLNHSGSIIDELWRLSQSLEGKRVGVHIGNLLDLKRTNYGMPEFQCDESAGKVLLVYAALLKRNPNPTEFAEGLAQFDQGQSIARFLWVIRQSAEGRRLGVKVRFLRFFHLLYYLRQRLNRSR